MKKLLLLFLSVIALSCSKDDDKSTPDYEVLSHSYEVEQNTVDGRIMRFTATVKNHTNEAVTGRIEFKIPKGNGNSYENITGVTLSAGETGTFTETGIGYYGSNTIEITKVRFVPEGEF